MTNALLLPNWIVTDALIDDDGVYQIAASPKHPPVYCSKCDRQSELSPIGTKPLKCVDAPVHGRQTFVTITLTRYQCGTCRGTFWESVGDFHPKRRMAHRCVRYIQNKSLLIPNTHVAEEVGVDESTVRRISNEHADALNAQHRRELRAPRLMGMDETTLAGSMRAV